VKAAQLEHDNRKVELNRKKEEESREKKRQAVEALKKTAANLVLDADEINRLKKDELNEQLDYHRDAERKNVPANLVPEWTIPCKSNMTTNPIRCKYLHEAVARYKVRQVPMD
ncbi:hypothetical protein BJ165DRAFT_1308933, partial [Panaeolus papilionaceus]